MQVQWGKSIHQRSKFHSWTDESRFHTFLSRVAQLKKQRTNPTSSRIARSTFNHCFSHWSNCSMLEPPSVHYTYLLRARIERCNRDDRLKGHTGRWYSLWIWRSMASWSIPYKISDWRQPKMYWKIPDSRNVASTRKGYWSPLFIPNVLVRWWCLDGYIQFLCCPLRPVRIS